MEATSLGILKDIAICNLIILGIYGTFYIHTKNKIWLIASLFFGSMVIMNLITINKELNGKSIFEREYLQTPKSSREPISSRNCCPSQKRQRDKNESSVPTQKRTDSIHGKRTGPTLRPDPNPRRPLQRLDSYRECKPCPDDK